MKSILISIQPQWVEKILNGEKTIEIRKTMPKCELPCKVYIYCTKGKNDLRIFNESVCRRFNISKTRLYTPSEQRGYTRFIGDESQSVKGKVVAEFTLNNVEEVVHYNNELQNKSQVSTKAFFDYKGNGKAYAWHIDNLKIYDEPKDIRQFKKQCSCYQPMSYEKIGCFEKGCPIYELGECDGKCIYLDRPPQSWCYVEGLYEN